MLDPIEAAPYRDIPHALNQIVKKCLQPLKELRYKQVVDLIADLESFMEGRPEWVPVQELKIERKEDWEFQENVLLAKTYCHHPFHRSDGMGQFDDLERLILRKYQS